MKTRWTTGLAVLAGILLTGCSDDSVGQDKSVQDLEVGDCFDIQETDVEQTVFTVPIVSCSGEHTSEVYHVEDVTGIDTYDLTTVYNAGVDMCLAAFEGYVGVDYWDPAVAELDFYVIYPEPTGWTLGDREIVCSLVHIDVGGTLTGSMKDAY